MTKRLYRSRKQKVLGGVCGGLGEHFDVDPVFVRILAVILVFAHGVGLIAYLVALIAMPRAPETDPSQQQTESSGDPSIEVQPLREPSIWRSYLPGLIFIFLGVVFLMDQFFWWFHWHHIWPVLLIIAGGAMIWRSITHKDNNGGVHESFES